MRQRHIMPFGAELTAEGVRFALWAPTASDVTLVVNGQEHALADEPDGWRQAVIPGAGPGSRYRYRVGTDLVPDPASRFQPEDVDGPSVVVDPLAYSWQDGGWAGRPWQEAVLYEVHVGTATPEGTFSALTERLPELARLGVTGVELMPVNAFKGRRNWGYDGVLPYAPDASYGSPDDLRRLVDRAHSLGLMMFLDVVYNHFGPVGNHLHKYARSFFTDRHKTPWGDGLNVDGADGGPVRSFFVENALYWLREYHFDGLRFDAVHAILDDSGEHIVAELATRARTAIPGRQIHLVLENERNESRWLERQPDGGPRLHTAQWNDDIHHCWHALLTGESEGYYEDFADKPVERLARCLAEGFAYQGEPSRHAGGQPRGEPASHLPPAAFVAFLQNHDQIGNRAFGDRLSAAPERLALARAALLLTPQIPMLFMGEEWGASTPFQFFVDFSDDPELSRAVREGRRREFRHFAAFSGSGENAIPDPTLEETFRNSTLDLHEPGRPAHAQILAETARLLAIRRNEVVPLTKSAFRGSETAIAGPDGLDVSWRYEEGALRFAAQFGPHDASPPRGAGRILWQSDGVREADGHVILPSWTAFVAIEPRT